MRIVPSSILHCLSSITMARLSWSWIFLPLFLALLAFMLAYPVVLFFLKSFAKSDKERQVLAMLRAFRLAGSPYVLPPGTPKERVEILQEAIRRSFKDAEFHKEFKKLTGDVPTPLMPETMDKYVRELPRSPEIIALFHKIAGAARLPER